MTVAAPSGRDRLEPRTDPADCGLFCVVGDEETSRGNGQLDEQREHDAVRISLRDGRTVAALGPR